MQKYMVDLPGVVLQRDVNIIIRTGTDKLLMKAVYVCLLYFSFCLGISDTRDYVYHGKVTYP